MTQFTATAYNSYPRSAMAANSYIAVSTRNQDVGQSHYMINCANIDRIQIKRKIGNGACKQGFLGEYRGTRVVVKYATENRTHLDACIRHLVSGNVSDGLTQRCFYNCHTQVMKDTLVMSQLKHRNLVKLLGYCTRSDEIDSNTILGYGAVSVFEYGTRVTRNALELFPWAERIRHAIEIANLINYFANSPIGSIKYPDLKLGHFVLVNGHLKIFDMDSSTATEERCGKDKHCPYRLRCVGGQCKGFNALFNLRLMHDVIFRDLLPTWSAPSMIKSDIVKVQRDMARGNVDATGMETLLRNIQQTLLESTT